MKTFSEIDRNPDRATLRQFRWVVAGGGIALALLFRFGFHRESAAVVAAGIGLGVAILSLVPGLGRPLYVGWMGLGVAIGMVTSPIVLAIVWYLVVTPTGWVMRLAGRDPMKLRHLPSGESYWEPHPPQPDARSYFRQF